MNNKRPIRILNIVPNMRAAGVETFIMNIYRNIDRNKVQFDFIVHNSKREFYDDEIESLGGKIYRFTYKDDKNFLKYIKDLKNFFVRHKEYNIVHGHMQSMMPIYLYIAKKCGVKIRIAHSHNNSYEKSLKGFILHVLSRFSKCFSTTNFACSIDAGKYLFGHEDFQVINNGIDMTKFKYNENKRKQIRKELGIGDDEILIGNIGRMEKQKNQFFLLDIFNEILKKNIKYKLIIIGNGSLKEKLIDYSKKIGVFENVIFKQNIQNIQDYMSTMDVFCLPSLYEGLGIVLIEAQTSGLKCYATKDSVASETKITDNIDYLPLDKQAWVSELIKNDNKYFRKTYKSSDFDIKNVAKNMQDIYVSLYRK